MNWPLVPLEKVARVSGGSTPKRNKDAYWNGNVPWVTPSDLPAPGASIVDVVDTVNRITQAGLNSCSAELLSPGTVLFSARATIGKIGIAKVPLATNQGFANFTPCPGVEPRYLAYALQFFTPQIAALAGSTTFKEVSRGAIRKFQIPLPPLSEQRRIVEILDQADALRRKRAEADAKAQRILPGLFIRMFGDPATNPMGWPIRPLREFLSSVERRNPADCPDESFVYIDIAGVDGSTGRIAETKTLLGSAAPSRARQVVRACDVLVSTVRPYLRAIATVPKHLDGQICSTGFCVLRSAENYGHGYLYALSRMPWFTDQLNARARGASYPAVTDRDIFDLEVPIPNNSSLLSVMDEVVDKYIFDLERMLNNTRRVETLFQSLVARAFSGELTAKWREAHLDALLKEAEEQAVALAEEREGKRCFAGPRRGRRAASC